MTETSEPTVTGQDTISRKHPAAKCEECPLFEVRRAAYAGGEGPEDAELIIVGEAPGFQEAQTGRPFAGPSGKLLDTVLAHHGIDRATAFVTNVVACRPPDNRTPTKTEIKACLPRLVSEIQRRPTKQVLALGNTAAQAVLDTRTGVTQLRSGPPKRGPVFPDVDVVPTVHPAYCLRMGDAFPSFVTDVGKLKPSTASVAWREPDYKVFDDPAQAKMAIIELYQKFDEFVIDIEVGIEKDTEFDHPDHYDMLCIGISYAPFKAIVIGENACKDNMVQKWLRELLLTKKLIAHNGKFDLAGLWAYLGGEYGTLYFDTMLASYVLDERPGTHGLKYLSVERLGSPQYDDELKRYINKGDSYAVVPRDVLYKYNAYDVACTWLLYEMFRDEMDKEGVRRTHDFLVEVSNELIHLEMSGIHVDDDYLDQLTEEYLQKLGRLEQALRPWVENPRSPKQVSEALHDMGFKVASTDVETLLALQQRSTGAAREFIDLMLEHRKEQKLYGTYVKGTRKRIYKGRVHPTFLLHGTTTGRSACRNPNLQNVPRGDKIRSLFVPAPGNVFVQGDYEQAELRAVLTEAEQRGQVYDALMDPTRNVFDELTLELYGEGWTKEDRVRTKAFVHGTNYGRTYFSIAMEYKMSAQEGERLQKRWLEKIPEVVAWQERIKHQVLHEQEDLVTKFGRHRRFWLITEDNKKDVINQALAFIPQSTASDICLSALVRLRRVHGLEVRLPVHDSILVECRPDDAEEVAALMAQVMEDTARELYTDFIRFPAEVKIGANWGEL